MEGTLAAEATVEVEGAMSATIPGTLVAKKVEVRFPSRGNGAPGQEAKGPITALNATDLTPWSGGLLGRGLQPGTGTRDLLMAGITGRSL